MYFDEDGDLAHEFYEEVRADNSGKTVMERRSTNLRPQVTPESLFAHILPFLTSYFHSYRVLSTTPTPD